MNKRRWNNFSTFDALKIYTMNISKIISIPGQSGLYKMIAQTNKNGIIVESIIDKKRIPAYATQKMIQLEDVAIFTTGEDKPLKELFQTIYEKENGGECISHKQPDAELKAYFTSVLPNYDAEKVHVSVIKKVVSWYNILKAAGLLDEKEVELTEEEKVKIKANEDKANVVKTNAKNINAKPLKTAGSKVATQGVRKTGVA